jgi:hypothetical protein
VRELTIRAKLIQTYRMEPEVVHQRVPVRGAWDLPALPSALEKAVHQP